MARHQPPDPAPAEAPLRRAVLHVPTGWEESLIWQLQEDGFGLAMAETEFADGYLEGEERGRVTSITVTTVVPVGREEALRSRVHALAARYGWRPESWDLRFGAEIREGWEDAWRRRWRPFRCGRFSVRADFHDPESLPRKRGDRPLVVAAGSAFGTGGHTSTRMALMLLERWAGEASLGRVLDVGTGSGILAVAAALLDAKAVFGMDPDPASAEQARRTAQCNGVAGQCRFWRGTADSARGPFETIVANLQAELLVALAPSLRASVAPGGRLFAGGILDSKEERTWRAFEAQGFQLRTRKGVGRWRTGDLRAPG